MSLFNFVHDVHGAVHRYVATLNDTTTPTPQWPALWESEYGPGRANPYYRFGVNNADGEGLAVWRAFAWTLLGQAPKFVIPTWDRDRCADYLDVSRDKITMVNWEYKVDVEQVDAEKADAGFVPARSVVPTRPEPDRWELTHADRAGIFGLTSFGDLTKVELAMNSDVSSDMALFGVADRQLLIDSLNTADMPTIDKALRPGDRFVDLAIVRDRFLGLTSYIVVKSIEPIDSELERAVDAYDTAYGNYCEAVAAFRGFDDFAAAMDTLLAAGWSAR